LLTDRGDGALDGMPTVAVIAAAIALVIPVLFWRVERAVQRKETRRVLRSARASDRAPLGDLLVRSFVDTYAKRMPEVVVTEDRKASLRRAVEYRDRGYVAVVETNGKITGTVTLLKPGDSESRAWVDGHAYLRYMAVDPRIHGSGLGDELLNAALARAKEWGCSGICLHVRRGADGVARFYGRHGFRREPEGDRDQLPEIFLEGYRLGR
jgi:ribosomal protein S18 acetylase RimI-like enzyme